MSLLEWRGRLKAVAKPLIPPKVLSFYQQFREPFHLPDRSEVVLFADADTLPEFNPRFDPSSEPPIHETKREKITLIATVYNESHHISAWLDSLRDQRRLPDEIVITDGGSTDDTLAILHQYAEGFPIPIKVFSKPGANIASGRNLAIAKASNDIIACSDCGSLLDKNWLHALILPFELDEKVLVSAGYYDVIETNTLSNLARRFFGVNLNGVDPQTFLPSGRSLAFRKKMWAEAGEYPEWLTDAGEDTLFDLRLKAQPARWAFVPEARVSWYAPDTLRKLLRTYFRYARGDGETGISAGLYWYKVVELLRLWPRRLFMLALGIGLAIFWPMIGVIYFGSWMVWSLWQIWKQNLPYAEISGHRFFPSTPLLELVGTVQAVAFTLGVLARSKVCARELAFYQSRLNEILEKNPGRQGVIVYPPTHDWGFMFQRPHQIARAFAHQNWLFFFCTENRRTDAVFGFREIEPGLFLTNVPDNTFELLDKMVIYLGSVWNRPWVDHYNAPVIIYDHYDDLEVSNASEEDHLLLLQEADIVVVTAQRLMKVVKIHREDAILVPNAVDYNFIQISRPREGTPPPEDLLAILELDKPIVGYSGALAKWFDYELLALAAQQYPSFSFVLVGVDYDGSLERSKVLDLPNIFYLGMKNYSELFNYIWRFDVTIIPFKVNEITMATSPVKLFEYMACRKPIVLTDLPECRGYAGILLAKNQTQFLEFLGRAMQQRDDPEHQILMDKIAKENTWDRRVAQIIHQLSGKRQGNSSIRSPFERGN